MQNLITSIKTGEYELADSGIVQVLENEQTVLSFKNKDLSLIFSFDKTESGEPGIRFDGSQEKKVHFIILNVTLPTYGTTEFFKFGEVVEGEVTKGLFISFRVHSLNDKKIRSLEYSIFKK